MSIFLAIVGGIIGVIAGYVGAAFLSDIVMGWYGVSDFEGGRGMAAVFLFGPLGGLLGLVGGIWLGLRLGGKQPLGATLKRAGIAVVGILAIAAAALAIQYQSVPHRLEYDGTGAELAFELRAPADFALPANSGAIKVTLDTDLNQQPAVWHEQPLRQEAEWQVLSGTVELYFRTSQRLLVFHFPDGRDRIFRTDLAAKPRLDQGWSAWRKVDFVGLPDRPQTEKPGPEDPLELRYRVRMWGAD